MRACAVALTAPVTPFVDAVPIPERLSADQQGGGLRAGTGLEGASQLEPHFRLELAHALAHLPLIAVLRRVTGVRWAPE